MTRTANIRLSRRKQGGGAQDPLPDSGSYSPSAQATRYPRFASPQAPMSPRHQGKGGAGSAAPMKEHAPRPEGAGGRGDTRPRVARSPSRLGTGHPPPRPRNSRRISQPRLTREERKAMRRLRERNAQQWIDAVKKIRTPSVRAQAAAIVLWDWLYDATDPWLKNRRPLDKWAGEYSEETCPKPAVLARALVKVGYPARLAEIRAWIGEDSRPSVARALPST